MAGMTHRDDDDRNTPEEHDDATGKAVVAPAPRSEEPLSCNTPAAAHHSSIGSTTTTTTAPAAGTNASRLPNWNYKAVSPLEHQHLPHETVFTFPPLDGPDAVDLGHYARCNVSNAGKAGSQGRAYFDLGLRLMLSYQHEMAAKCFLACLEHSPYCALAHGCIALCHSPNYNFKGRPYYESTCHLEEIHQPDLLCIFPSQQVADRHSRAAVETIEELRRRHKAHAPGSSSKKKTKAKGKGAGKTPANRNNNNPQSSDPPAAAGDETPVLPELISEVEAQLLQAIRILTCCPGVDPDLAEETVGRPFATAMRKLYRKYPHDAEIVYCFAESIMVLNAWQLYEYPSGKPVSDDVEEVRHVLELALREHSHHAGLCHLYVHLSEMSAHPEAALSACQSLRTLFPDAGHLLHMGTHIDVLVGDYESCVRFNEKAILADRHVMKCSPSTAEKESFYFGYIVHNYHMLVFGAILGAMEGKAVEAARELNELVHESMFVEYENLAAYLESYSALDVHVMVRFGRWEELLRLEPPKNKRLMLYRSASIYYARGLAYAALGNVAEAKKEMDRLNSLRQDPEAALRILHNNSVADLLAVDAVMLRGEILYREERYEDAFTHLRRAVEMQDNLNYDEPWGKMQPIRHALGGLLLEQGQVEEAAEVFRKDLKLHPKNPFALVGLIRCMLGVANHDGVKTSGCNKCIDVSDEVAQLQQQLAETKCEWSDFDVVVSCECCQRPSR